MTPRGIRNNNPGNIDKSKLPWRGEVLPGSDPRFITFQSMPYGIRAMAIVIKNYVTVHHLVTIRQIISRWAPPSENNTEAYIEAVCKSMGVADSFNIWNNMFNRLPVMAALICSIAMHENGGHYLTDKDIVDGVELALE